MRLSASCARRAGRPKPPRGDRIENKGGPVGPPVRRRARQSLLAARGARHGLPRGVPPRAARYVIFLENRREVLVVLRVPSRAALQPEAEQIDLRVVAAADGPAGAGVRHPALSLVLQR